MTDIVRERSHLFLGSRLKRLGERMQSEVVRIVEAAGLPIQPAQYPLLAALDRDGPMAVGDLVRATGISQPGVTRSLLRLAEMGYVVADRSHPDQRRKTVALTEVGSAAVAQSKREVWPKVEAAVVELCQGLSGSLLDQLNAVEDALNKAPLDVRASVPSRLTIREFSDDLAPHFHDINAQWIEAMFRLEATDREVLENPRARIIDKGGAILFVEAAGLGVVGACALQKTGERQFELTKMGVLESARGLKVGEFLLRAMIDRAEQMQVDNLYLLTNTACQAAIHLYEKLGFAHDAGIMRDFGARYERCNVAMRYRGEVATGD